jgi:hypothetical protein
VNSERGIIQEFVEFHRACLEWFQSYRFGRIGEYKSCLAPNLDAGRLIEEFVCCAAQFPGVSMPYPVNGCAHACWQAAAGAPGLSESERKKQIKRDGYPVPCVSNLEAGHVVAWACRRGIRGRLGPKTGLRTDQPQISRTLRLGLAEGLDDVELEISRTQETLKTSSQSIQPWSVLERRCIFIEELLVRVVAPRHTDASFDQNSGETAQ